MSLLSSIIIELSNFHLEKLHQIDSFNYDSTKKKVSEQFSHSVTEDYLNTGIENLKKYYAIALLDPKNEHAVSKFVDPFWHAHILHTKKYIDFCDSIFGQYIQHEPLDEENTVDYNKVKILYDYTLKTYKKVFSHVDPSWWPDLSITNNKKGPVVCRHMFIENTLIRKHACFEKNMLLTQAA